MANQIAKTRKTVAADRQVTMSRLARLAGARSKASNLLHRDLERQAMIVVNKSLELRTGLCDARERMAKQQQVHLKHGHQRLHAGMTKVVDAIHADRMKAQAIWSSFRAGSVA